MLKRKKERERDCLHRMQTSPHKPLKGLCEGLVWGDPQRNPHLCPRSRAPTQEGILCSDCVHLCRRKPSPRSHLIPMPAYLLTPFWSLGRPLFGTVVCDGFAQARKPVSCREREGAGENQLRADPRRG